MYYSSLKDYLNKMEKDRPENLAEKFPELYKYSNQLENKLSSILEQINPQNFWKMLPVILGIDAKFVLLRDAYEDICLYGFSEIDVIHNIESDYKSINQEQCGYHLDTCPYDSLIFDVK